MMLARMRTHAPLGGSSRGHEVLAIQRYWLNKTSGRHTYSTNRMYKSNVNACAPVELASSSFPERLPRCCSPATEAETSSSWVVAAKAGSACHAVVVTAAVEDTAVAVVHAGFVADGDAADDKVDNLTESWALAQIAPWARLRAVALKETRAEEMRIEQLVSTPAVC